MFRFFLVLFFMFSGQSFVLACEVGTEARFYECKGDSNLNTENARKAQQELDKEMSACTKEKPCCIKTISNRIARKAKCKVKFIVK